LLASTFLCGFMSLPNQTKAADCAVSAAGTVYAQNVVPCEVSTNTAPVPANTGGSDSRSCGRIYDSRAL
jgi:hypothetical protein